MVTACLHVNALSRSSHDDARFHRRSLLQCFVNRRLKLHFLAATPTAVGRNHDLATRIVDPIDESSARETTEDHRMGGANACTREHRDGQLWNQRHVERDAIAFANP